MADLVLKPDFDITEAEAKINKLNRRYDDSIKKVGLIEEKVKNLNSSLEDEKNRQKEIRNEIAMQTEEAAKLSKQIDKVKNGNATMQEIMDLGSIETAKTKLAEMENSIKKNETAFDNSKNASKKLSYELNKQKYELEKQKNKTADIGDQILLNSKKQNKFTQAFAKSTKSADRFGKRLKSLIASALFFSVVTKAFTALRNEFGKLITETGTKTAALVAQLNSNLAVLGRTLYESARPAIEWILEKLVQITKVLTIGLAKILGKNIDQMKQLTKETKKAGKEAEKSTAGFDTVQTLGSSSADSSNSNNGTDFTALNSEISNEIAVLMAIISGAALVLGVILAFTGTNIPLGLGLIALGAVGLAATYSAKWDSLDPEIKNTISTITAIVSIALLVLGVILAFSGVNIPLGIGLILAGATGLAATYTTNWDTLPQKTKNTISSLLAIGGALFILLGLILILTGAGIPLGIGLILLGVTALGMAVALSPGDSFTEKVCNLWNNVKQITKNFIDWFSSEFLDGIFGENFGDSLQDMLDSVFLFFEDIISFFKNVFAGNWKEAGKDLVNIWIDWINILISKFNVFLSGILGGGSKLLNKIGELFGADWNLNADWAKIPKIPRLATGAILPGGSPMLAWVNDQPKGQPYVEGSIENIAAAFEKYFGNNNLGNPNFTVRATGSLAPLIRLLNLEIQKENKRNTVWG